MRAPSEDGKLEEKTMNVIRNTLLITSFALICSTSNDVSAFPDTDSEAECIDLVQGKVSWEWDANGTKYWSSNYVTRLCKGTKTANEPVDCYVAAAHEKSVRLVTRFKDAMTLCRGVSSARDTLECIRNQPDTDDSLQRVRSLQKCNEIGEGSG